MHQYEPGNSYVFSIACRVMHNARVSGNLQCEPSVLMTGLLQDWRQSHIAHVQHVQRAQECARVQRPREGPSNELQQVRARVRQAAFTLRVHNGASAGQRPAVWRPTGNDDSF
jgi:hypothetical protein